MLFYALATLINVIAVIFLGVIVYLKNRKVILNKLFALFCFSVFLWSSFYFLWLSFINNKQTALLFGRALNIVAIFIPVTYFHFITVFLNIYQKKKKLVIFGYLLAFILFISGFTPLFVRDVAPELFFSWYPKPGITYHLFTLMFFSFVVYSWYLMLGAIKKVTGVAKLQIKYFLIGTLIGFTGGSTSFFLVYGIPIPPFGTGLVVFSVIFITLAILKYHLFEIRVILTEILVGAMGIILLILPFVMPTSSLRILTLAIFLLFLVFAYYLLKATHEEERRREEAEKIAIQERALRERSEKLAREFEKLARAKDQFLLSIQHHLRTPLTPIRGYAEMILEGTYGKEENPKIKEKLLAIKKSADTLHNLMESLLDIQALRMGKEILNLEKCQLTDLIEEVIEELKPQAKEKGIPLYFEKDSLPEMKLDKKRIKEVIWNLIDNAIKYTNKGKVNIKVQNLKSKALLMVSDTGIGMTEEEREYFLLGKLFERGVEAKKLFGPGRGVGLAISIEFVKAHGGKIWVESEGRGKGTTFYVELPINQDNGIQS